MNPILDTTLQSLGLKKLAPTPLDVKLLSGTTDYLGRTQPMGLMTGNSAAAWMNTTGNALTTEGYAAHAIAYTIISRIVEAASVIPWRVYKRNADGQLEVDTKHPLNALLAHPNERDNWCDVIGGMGGHLLTGGNTFLQKESPLGGLNAGKPKAVRVLPTPQIEVRGNEGWSDPVTTYRETIVGQGRFIDHLPEDVCHVKYWNPNSSKYGLAPAAAGYKLLTAADAGLSARVRSYQNQGPPGILTKKGQGESWGDTGAQAAKSWFSSFMRGGRNQNNVPVVTGDVAWVALGLSPVDLDVLAALAADRDGIADLYSYPGQLLNGSKGTTFNNVGEAKRSFYSGCVIPLLQKIQQRLSPFLCDPYGDGAILDFDSSGVPELQANKKEQAEWLTLAWWVPTQEKQRIMGITEDDTLQPYYIPSMLTAYVSPEDAAAQAVAEAAAVKRYEESGIQDYK